MPVSLPFSVLGVIKLCEAKEFRFYKGRYRVPGGSVLHAESGLSTCSINGIIVIVRQQT